MDGDFYERLDDHSLVSLMVYNSTSTSCNEFHDTRLGDGKRYRGSYLDLEGSEDTIANHFKD